MAGEADYLSLNNMNSDKPAATAFTIDFGDPNRKSTPRRKPAPPATLTKKPPLSPKPARKQVNAEPPEEAANNGAEDNVSETGTYTIDDEEEEEDSEIVGRRSEKKQDDNKNWVSNWVQAISSPTESTTTTASSSGASPTSPVSSITRSRRKLPPVPCGTDTILRDTMSTINAMEARLESKKTPTPSSAVAKQPVKKLSVQEERKLNWERRKNYDPRKNVAVRTRSSDIIPSPIEHHQQQQQAHHQSPARPNKAFDLRQKMNSSNTSPISRDDGGRFSMRNHHHQQQQKKVGGLPMRRMEQQQQHHSSVRSTSSLSSKEAEFQAWKRRKNYNPMKSANASKTKAAPAAQQQPLTIIESKKDELQQPMLRSASFHYPDGESRTQRNVYTSEEDDEDDEQPKFSSLTWRRNDKFLEVNEDEFILPIGGGVTARGSSNEASGSSPMGRRLEALDSLVISTIFSLSARLCKNSATLVKKAQDECDSEEQISIMDTLLYVLEDTDLPPTPSKKTSRELAGTLRNLKKVEQALKLLHMDDDDEDEDDDSRSHN